MLTSQAIADRERLLKELGIAIKAIPRSRLTPEDVQLMLSAAKVIRARLEEGDAVPSLAPILTLHNGGRQ